MIQLKSLSLGRMAALAGAGASLLFPSASGQAIPNPSFEANTFAVAPGYVSDNSPITGWSTDNPGGVGLSPAGGDSTFANNGAIPNGSNAAFITGGSTLSTTITGLTPGTVYKITLQANASTGQTPILRAAVDSVDLIALNIYPVSGTAPYQYIAFEFTAAAATATLTLANDAGSDQTVLVDNLSIANSTGRWRVEAWTDDATSGADTQFVYTHSYNFGSGSTALINGVPFTGVGGANPRVDGKFTASRFPNVFNNDANNITGGSAVLARDFLYSGANVSSGTYQSIALEGLTPGTEYVITIYSAGWESPSTSARWATFSVGDDRLTANQDLFDNNNGIAISHRYTAVTNTAVFNIAPVNPVNVSIHVYGFSNREAVSRNVAPSIGVQPISTTISQGLPLDLAVTAFGFPAPSFQWRFNGAAITGGTNAAFNIASATAVNAGLYDVIVSNQVGRVTSVVARVTVGIPMANSSFEADSFVSWPGYSGENPGSPTTPTGPNTPITGWTQSLPENSGINPIATGEAPFADNGTIPHGRQVAFLQSVNNGINTLSQTVTGLTPGSQYYLHFYENSRAATGNPALEVTLGNNVAVPNHLIPSGSYREVFSDVFTAAAASVDVTFTVTSPNGADVTALLDNVAIVPVAAGTAPFITRQPVAAAAAVGQGATFSAHIIGSLPLSLQWFRDGTAITGATNATLTLSNLALDAAGAYTLRATNAGGSITTAPALLTVNQPIPGLFNTGVNNNGEALGDAETDPHYELIVNPHVESTAAIVQDSTVFPIVGGPWLANTAASKWIGPALNTSDGAVGLYTYRTVFTLTNRDPRSVSIIGRWASDNAGRDILVNGVSTGNAQSPGFNVYTPFAIYGTNTTFVNGTNTIDFVVENEAAIGFTGLRVEFLQSNALPAGSGGTAANLRITRDGNSISISWTPAAAGQRLQSSTRINGGWEDVANASNPYTTTIGAGARFFRVIQ